MHSGNQELVILRLHEDNVILLYLFAFYMITDKCIYPCSTAIIISSSEFTDSTIALLKCQCLMEALIASQDVLCGTNGSAAHLTKTSIIFCPTAQAFN